MICYTNKWKVPFQIDEDDYEMISYYYWQAAKSGLGYLSTKIPVYTEYAGKWYKIGQRTMYLHIFLGGKAPEGHDWDHINRDKLDNRRSNLRIVTKSENMRNKDHKSKASGLQGVLAVCDGRWSAHLSSYESPTGRRKRLGTFFTIEEARAAREKALKEYNL